MQECLGPSCRGVVERKSLSRSDEKIWTENPGKTARKETLPELVENIEMPNKGREEVNSERRIYS